LPLAELTVFSMLGALMFVSKYLTQVLPPNTHLLALFIAAFTLTWRVKALIPLYVFVFLEGLFGPGGFSVWWIMYLYAWLPLWGMVMLISKIKMPRAVQIPAYMSVCALHGFIFGVLCAPVYALAYGLSFQGMAAWIAAGLPFDFNHGVSNFAAGTLVVPLSVLLKKLDRR
jgi:energy-coupling factor transport system substrate-specific component